MSNYTISHKIAMARGKKTGGGPRTGSPNIEKQAFRERMEAYCKRIGCDPFQFMADTIIDGGVEYGLRVTCAKELANYFQPKLKAIEHTGEVAHDVTITYEVSLD